MGAAHAGVHREGRSQLDPRPLVLAEIAVGAADEDVGLGDRPGLHDLREEALGQIDLLLPEVAQREREGQLDVVGRARVRLLQLLHRLAGLAVRHQGLREQLADLAGPGGSCSGAASGCPPPEPPHAAGGARGPATGAPCGSRPRRPRRPGRHREPRSGARRPWRGPPRAASPPAAPSGSGSRRSPSHPPAGCSRPRPWRGGVEPRGRGPPPRSIRTRRRGCSAATRRRRSE